MFWNCSSSKFPSATHFFYIKSSLIWHPLFYNIKSPWSVLTVLKNSRMSIEVHNPSRAYEYCPWSTMYHTPFIHFCYGFNGHATSQGHSSHMTINHQSYVHMALEYFRFYYLICGSFNMMYVDQLCGGIFGQKI